MTCDNLKGITNLDTEVLITNAATSKTVAEISLQQVLLKKFKLTKGTSLIAEVHQRGPMGTVDVIVPNIPKAEVMILMINQQFPAFCLNYLIEKGMDKKFVRALIKEACCPTLVGEINECTWDLEKTA